MATNAPIRVAWILAVAATALLLLSLLGPGAGFSGLGVGLVWAWLLVPAGLAAYWAADSRAHARSTGK